jgi:Tol biopolymer transport system component
VTQSMTERLMKRTAPLPLLVLVAACGSDAGCDRANPLMPVCVDLGADAASPEPALVLASNRSGVFEIYVMNSDGSAIRRLTTNPGPDVMPAWSPDGRRIVFASARDGSPRELYVMNADGSDQQRLTSLGNNPGWPDWSPDGTRIAFHAARGDGNFDLYIINADGSGLRRLTTTDSYLRPRWSPDGTRLAFNWYQSTVGGTCCARVGVVHADGTGLRVLASESMQDMDPAWAPDGRQLAFSRYRGMNAMGYPVLAVVNADGTGERELGTNTMGAVHVAWSRGSGRIFFASMSAGSSAVYSVRPNGSDVRRVSGSNDQQPDVR